MRALLIALLLFCINAPALEESEREALLEKVQQTRLSERSKLRDSFHSTRISRNIRQNSLNSGLKQRLLKDPRLHNKLKQKGLRH